MTNTKMGKVLCLDDDPKVTRALGWALQKKFAVTLTASVVEGVELVKANDFDVVISDRSMPELSGVDFLNLVKKISPRSIRVLLTGYSDPEEIVRAVNETEVFRLLAKPWALGELVSIVERGVAIARDISAELDETLHHVQIDAGETPERRDDRILVIDADPAIHAIVAQSAAGNGTVRGARNIAEAMTIINEGPIAVIVAETAAGGFDTTRLIRMLKQSRPETISLMVSRHFEPPMMVDLVNQGQVFRLLGKPLAANCLKPVIEAALRKHRMLKVVPAAARRHLVDNTSAGTSESLLFDIERIAFSGERTALQMNNVAKIRAGFYRVFGLDRHGSQEPESAPA